MSRNICFSFECPHQTEALLGKQIFMRRPATLWHSQIRCAAFQIALMTFDSLNWEHSTKHMQAAVAKFRFYCVDSVGHSLAEITLRHDPYRLGGAIDSAVFNIPVESSAIDAFV